MGGHGGFLLSTAAFLLNVAAYIISDQKPAAKLISHPDIFCQKRT